MSAVGSLAAWLDSQQVWWPEGDGDTLRDAAGAWTGIATVLEGVQQTLDAAAGTLSSANTGSAAGSFGDLWASWSGDAGYLTTAIQFCNQLGAALSGFGADVDVADRDVTTAAEWAIVDSLPAPGMTDPPVAGSVEPDIAPSGVTQQALDFLRDAASQTGEALGNAATGQLPAGAMPSVAVPDLGPQGQAELTTVAWPTVSVFSALSGTSVDFGAGQGTVIPSTGDVTAPSPDGTITVTVDGHTTTVASDPTSTVTITTSGETITVTPAAAAPAAAPVPVAPVDYSTPLADPTTLAALPAAAVAAKLATKKLKPAKPVKAPPLPTSGLGGGGGLGGSFSVPKIPALPTSKPVTVPPPATAPIAADTSAFTVPKAAATKASSSVPFMPMGGMGGAGGGASDDGEEKTRRRRLPRT